VTAPVTEAVRARDANMIRALATVAGRRFVLIVMPAEGEEVGDVLTDMARDEFRAAISDLATILRVMSTPAPPVPTEEQTS